jgi:hypothetical protein
MSNFQDRVTLYTTVRRDLNIRNWMAVVFFGGIAVWAVFTRAENQQADPDWWKFYGMGVMVLALVASLQVLMNKGYRLSYDDEAV